MTTPPPPEHAQPAPAGYTMQPPPPYAAPAAAPAPRNRVVALGVTLGVVVLVAVGALAWLLTRGGTTSPAGTVEGLIAAVTADDCARVQQLTSPEYFADSFRTCDDVTEASGYMGDVIWQVGDAVPTAEGARVAVTTSFVGGEEWTRDGFFLLEKRGSAWVVVADE
jgi:hypothetical protein